MCFSYSTVKVYKFRRMCDCECVYSRFVHNLNQEFNGARQNADQWLFPREPIYRDHLWNRILLSRVDELATVNCASWLQTELVVEAAHGPETHWFNSLIIQFTWIMYY